MINPVCQQPWKQAPGDRQRPCAPAQLCGGVSGAVVGSWKGRNSSFWHAARCSDALALAVGSFTGLCGAAFPGFQEGRRALTGSGKADSSHSEKWEGGFIQHSTYEICAVKKGLGNQRLFSILHILLSNGAGMLNYIVSCNCSEDIIRLKSLRLFTLTDLN